ncbi:PA1571 family protein [Oceanicoccus sagamiensis]|uniref:Uncharacterized protein n=1 Tax=Oceanicoccus sagamiensis TaxID=716816 RepID=A0A1X9NEB7_9GAMM|nr:PA1571 family protein [Oceanicoccus sagamiensis]ARN75896.1 hypothetical protein BST96_18395 [Oceanicoccus sagamiensis]
MNKQYANFEDSASTYSDPLDALLFDEQLLDEDYHGAIIDLDGNEQPITEAMILAACAALEEEVESIYGAEFSGK